MTTAWILGTTSLFVTTVGALLIFLYLTQAPKLVGDDIPVQVKQTCEKHRRMLMIATGLLAAWLLVQYLAVILL